jgi:hypothetical protein
LAGSLTSIADHNRSAAAAARGYVIEIILVVSTNFLKISDFNEISSFVINTHRPTYKLRHR